MSDPANLKLVMDDLTRTAKLSARYGVFGFDLADEPSLTHWEATSNVCFCPFCLAGFAKWIKTQYPTLAALNAEWGTDFENWGAVSPMIESEVRNRDNLAPWNDYRAWMEEVWTNFFREARATIKAECPQARVGVCGMQDGHPYSGFDLWKLHDVFDFVMPYTNSAVWRSFTPAGKYGRYTGYRIPPDQQISDNWKDFFDGQFVFSYFLGLPGAGRFEHQPHLCRSDPRDHAALRPGHRQAVHQIGPLERPHGHPLFPAQHPRRLHAKVPREGSAGLPGALPHVSPGLRDLFHDLGYDTGYLANEQITQGALTPAQYRMLVLPHALALIGAGSGGDSAIRGGRRHRASPTICPACMMNMASRTRRGAWTTLFGVKRTQSGHDRLTYQPLPDQRAG